MIVKNEEDVIERCLNSCYEIFDEIIIVDTGSEDRTKDIARKFTDKVYDFAWVNDFSKARNFSLSKCSSDYFMWLDADDVITKENLEKLKNLKNNLSDEDVIMMKYSISFDENDKPTFTYFRERICRNCEKFLFHDFVHEVITPSGKIIYEDIEIEHRKIKENISKRNLKLYEKNLKKVKFSARQQFYYSRELYFNNKIDKAIVNFKKFLKMENFYIENKIEACLNLSNCYLIKKDSLKAKEILFYSFLFDKPRSEILCSIAYIYKNEGDYTKAIYYFDLASQNEINYSSGGFIQKDFYNYIPYLEMCVCYFNLKDYEKSYYYNMLALKVKPNSEICKQNEKIIKNYLKK